MARIEIELLKANLEAAHRTDRFHSIRNNLEPVTEDEWSLRPADYSVELFGTDPELSIGDLAMHVAGAMRWDGIRVPGTDRAAVLAWLDANVMAMIEGLLALPDDAALALERETHWGAPMPVAWFVRTMTNHMLYHSGEINRQLSIIRGTGGGWVSS
jgi:hypothetical protein